MPLAPAQRRRLINIALAGIAVAFGATVIELLDNYDVPFLLVLVCSLATATSFLSLAGHVQDALATVTHRCTAPDCTFRVRVSGVDAAENRRWQEVAAAHPRHDTARAL